MPRVTTSGFRVETTRLDGTEPILELIEMSVPLYPQSRSVRLVNDSDDVEFEGQTYSNAGFGLVPPDDVERQTPQAQVTLAIVSSRLVKFIENTNGAQGALLRLIVTRRSSLIAEHDITLEFADITLQNGVVQGRLGYTDLMSRASLNQRYDEVTAKALF